MDHSVGIAPASVRELLQTNCSVEISAADIEFARQLELAGIFTLQFPDIGFTISRMGELDNIVRTGGEARGHQFLQGVRINKCCTLIFGRRSPAVATMGPIDEEELLRAPMAGEATMGVFLYWRMAQKPFFDVNEWMLTSSRGDNGEYVFIGCPAGCIEFALVKVGEPLPPSYITGITTPVTVL